MKSPLSTIVAGCIAAVVGQFVPAFDGRRQTTSPANYDSVLAPCTFNGGCDCKDSACDSSVCGCPEGNFIGNRIQPCRDCDNACDSAGFLGSGGLLGLDIVQKSDACFNDFISPITNPTYFEDPRNLSELRFIYAHHNVPAAALGGDINVFAMQFRARLTERLSLIATKDGYMTSSNPLLTDGWMGVNAGLKYNWYSDAMTGVLYSSGVTFEIPMGSTGNFQKYGNGQFHFFTTHGRRIGRSMHWLSAVGARIPADDNLQNRMIYWSNHLDYRVAQNFWALTELNWYNWASSGAGPLNGIEGGDLFSLGSSNVTGNDIVTQAAGFKYKRKSNRELGFAYEYPLTQRTDVIKDRVTVDYILRY